MQMHLYSHLCGKILAFVLIESAMCNLFIISSNCKKWPSEFLENGKGGILFESNKDNALKDALNKFLITKNLNEKKNFDKKRIVKNIQSLGILIY